MSKWIEFKETIAPGSTKRFHVVTKDNGAIIAMIKWYPSWRKYSFFPYQNTVFETQCLKDIVSFIDSLMLERKLQKQNQ